MRCLVAVAAAAVAATAAATTAAVTTTVAATTAAAVAATTTATTAAVTTTAAATARAVFAGLGFVDGQRPAAVLLAVQRGDRRLRFVVGAHLDEPEALAPAGVRSLMTSALCTVPCCANSCSQVRAVNVVAQVPDVQTLPMQSPQMKRAIQTRL